MDKREKEVQNVQVEAARAQSHNLSGGHRESPGQQQEGWRREVEGDQRWYTWERFGNKNTADLVAMVTYMYIFIKTHQNIVTKLNFM